MGARPSIEEVVDNGDYWAYLMGLVYYAVPAVVFFLATIIASIVWCICANKDARHDYEDDEHSQSIARKWVPRGVVLALLAGVFVPAMLYSAWSAHTLSDTITDMRHVVDALVDRADFVNTSLSSVRDQGLELAPDVQTYFASNGTLDSMQLAFNAELQALSGNVTQPPYSWVQEQITSLHSAPDDWTHFFALNNTNIAGKIDDWLGQLADGRAKALDYRNKPILDDIQTNTSGAALGGLLGLLALLLIWVGLMVVLPKHGGCCVSSMQFVVIAVFLSIVCIVSMLIYPLGIALGDGCDYIKEQESVRLVPWSNSSAWRYGYACLHNENLLTAADVNITQVLNLDDWVKFPDANLTIVPLVVPANVSALEVARIDATTQSIRLIQNVRVVLDPLLQLVRAAADDAVCGDIGTEIYALRDRICKLPVYFTGMGVCLSLFVAMALVSISLRTCKAPSYEKL